jgi:hypothetical protein
MITSVAKMLCWEFTFARSVYSPDYVALVDLSIAARQRGEPTQAYFPFYPAAEEREG